MKGNFLVRILGGNDGAIRPLYPEHEKKMSNIAKHIDQIINYKLKQLMKIEGFKKKARNFHKEMEESTLILNIQGSSYNSDSFGRFTVNLGVFLPEIRVISGMPKVNGIPTEPSCQLRKRIGMLMPSMKDHWWEASVEDSVEKLGDELAVCVEQCALPWLYSNSTYVGAKDSFNDINPFIEASAAIHYNNHARAEPILSKIIKTNEHASKRAKRMAKKYNINIA